MYAKQVKKKKWKKTTYLNSDIHILQRQMQHTGVRARKTETLRAGGEGLEKIPDKINGRPSSNIRVNL